MAFWTIYWTIWLLMILVADPIAMWRGDKDGLGDKFTFTHYAVIHLGSSVIAGIIGYLLWHFLIVHRSG